MIERLYVHNKLASYVPDIMKNTTSWTMSEKIENATFLYKIKYMFFIYKIVILKKLMSINLRTRSCSSLIKMNVT